MTLLERAQKVTDDDKVISNESSLLCAIQLLVQSKSGNTDEGSGQ